MMTRKNRIAYFYNDGWGNYHYGPTHPMKPHRLALTHELVNAYGLPEHMQMLESGPATDQDLMTFHSADYVAFLKRIRPDDQVARPVLGIPSSIGSLSEADFKRQLAVFYQRFNFVPDCPAFDGVYEFCSLYSGASLHAARHLARRQADVVINWSGGLHHAKKTEASGFCYVNDIVLAIVELLRTHPRVMYVDIDVHHGDGVQEAFYSTDRVMTVSFHQFGGGFFPGTGDIDEVGVGRGRLYAVNVPLLNGIDDAGYEYVFRPVMHAAIQSYAPTAIILQCGADSLRGDRLGGFNVSIHGHGACISYIHSFGIPLMVLGGGGYTIRNVSRCWTYETALLAGVALSNDLPSTPYDAFFGPDMKLHPPTSSLPKPVENANDRMYLDQVLGRVLKQLRALQGAPSVQWQVLPDYEDYEVLNEEQRKTNQKEENRKERPALWTPANTFHDE